MAVARQHAEKANEALNAAPGLDSHVRERLVGLVDGLVFRSS